MTAAMPVARVIDHLEQLVAALKLGVVHVRGGEEEVVLGARDVVDLAVNAKVSEKRHRLAIELTWRRKSRAPDDEPELEFRGRRPASERDEVEAGDTKADRSA